ncbi:MAG: hypothetical protein KGI26_01625 [Thaumarchaeota archaeon]|nr:hypothetical protein [Nitrososphaerota archaeon]
MANLSRDEKVENLVTNFSMIMMGMFEGVFSAMAAGLAEAMSGMAEALSGNPSAISKSDKAQMDAKLRDVFAGLRKEVSKGFANKNEQFGAFIKDPSFDAGVRIVESHDIGLPKLTEHLTDTDLARYVVLVQNEDPKLAEMMAELGEWQKTTPRFTQ